MRKILLLPLIIPFLTFVPTEIYLAGGGVLHAHGSAAALLLLGAGLSICVLAWECFAVPYLVFRVLKNKIFLRRSDIFSILLAVAYIFIAVLFALNLKLQEKMSDHPSHDQYVRSVREPAVEIARAMLDGQLSFLSGSRTLATLRSEAGVRDDDADFMTFVAIDSDTDDLPIGHAREYWDRTALEKLGPEIQAAEAWAKEQGKRACASLIARYSEQTG